LISGERRLYKRPTSGIVLILILGSLIGLALDIQPVKAEPTTVYIRADGSIDPSSANISTFDNITYTFTGNIVNQSIVVEREGITIDGSGFKLEDLGVHKIFKGIDLHNKGNVTIKNLHISSFRVGIFPLNSSNNIVTGNNITNGIAAIQLSANSSNNLIAGNNITENEDGVRLDYDCSNNTITGNNITENRGGWGGIYIHENSDNNVVSGNNITRNGMYGIYIYMSSDNNTITGNHVTENQMLNIAISGSSNNLIVGNNVTTAEYDYGITVNTYSKNNTINGNTIADNDYGVVISGANNTVSQNIITDNGVGVRLEGSSNNTIYRNDFQNNTIQVVGYYSTDNKIYHNNFFNGTIQIACVGSTDIWDDGYPSGGNYWDDYVDVDLMSGASQNMPGSDGIWDNAYVINSTNRDRYPFVNPFDNMPPVANAGSDQIVDEDTIVSFDGSSSYDNVGIVNYVWTFIDVTPQTLLGGNPTYTFMNPGVYTATLNVTDGAAHWDTDTVTISVSALTSEELTQRLVETIETSAVSKGTKKSLTIKLEDTLHLLEIGKEGGATHKLMDFICQVEALRGKKLTEEQADFLVYQAQKAINRI